MSDVLSAVHAAALFLKSKHPDDAAAQKIITDLEEAMLQLVTDVAELKQAQAALRASGARGVTGPLAHK